MNFKFSFKILNKCLVMGIPIMFTTLFTVIVNFSDKFFLEKNGSLTDLSNYYLAFSFAGIIAIIASSVQNVWMPMFMKETNLNINSSKTKKLVFKLTGSFIILAICIWILYYVFLIFKIIPEKYHQVIYILPILLITQIIVSISTILNNYLIYFEKTYLLLLVTLLMSLLSIVLNYFLTPKFGIYGAAYSTLLANVVYLLICNYLIQLFKQKLISENIKQGQSY